MLINIYHCLTLISFVSLYLKSLKHYYAEFYYHLICTVSIKVMNFCVKRFGFRFGLVKKEIVNTDMSDQMAIVIIS